MKIIDVKSGIAQPEIVVQGNDVIVHLNEVKVEKDEVVSYEYNGVMIENGVSYSDEAVVTVAKVFMAKAYLASTDFKTLPDYDQDNTEVLVKRQEARELIRANS
jgi:hypothetical protein